MKKLFAIALLLPTLAFADPITDMKDLQVKKTQFLTSKEFDGFMINMEVPFDARQMQMLKIKEFTYTLHATQRLAFSAQATMKIQDMETVTDFKFINFGTSYLLKKNLMVGTSVTSLNGTFDPLSSKLMFSMKYVY